VVARVEAWRSAHPVREAATFFLAGFVWDIITLDRIDSVLPTIQHAVWLVILAALLLLTERHAPGGVPPSPRMKKLLSVSEAAIHFFFGGLLSSFALFYVRSASGLAGMTFCMLMFGLLVGNELPQLRRLGPVIRFALYSFCITSWLAYVLPMAFGYLSVWIFLLSVLLAFGVCWGLFRLVVRFRGDSNRAVRTTLLPAAAMQALLVGLYTLQLVPPVPLSVQTMGVYHGLEKSGGKYRLLHQRADWKFWQRGDQEFLARDGDVVHVFAAVFAPRGFRDRVNIRFLREDPRRGWQTSDVIPLTITGGRDQGFRGHVRKSHHQPGDWRVQVETEDGRIIGHMEFEIIPDTATTERVFKEDLL